MADTGQIKSLSSLGPLGQLWGVVTVLGVWWGLWSAWAAAPAPQGFDVALELQEPLVPLPLSVTVDPARAALGARLFHDVRLSGRDTMACTTCHQLTQGGDDGRARSPGADGNLLPRNTPTVFNVAFNFVYHWDGAQPTLEAQAEQVLLNPAVMNTSWPALLVKLTPEYSASFRALYHEGLTPANILNALATYERSLITPNARIDRYLRGEQQALTAEEQRGYQLFKSYGCVACHHGLNVGGNLFQKFGVFPDLSSPDRFMPEADLGRFRVTGVARDRGVFRVPSLRNVAVTAPYFHDGRTSTLEDAVDIMARVQLGRTLSREEIDLIAQFLHTLTGEAQREWQADPTGHAP